MNKPLCRIPLLEASVLLCDRLYRHLWVFTVPDSLVKRDGFEYHFNNNPIGTLTFRVLDFFSL